MAEFTCANALWVKAKQSSTVAGTNRCIGPPLDKNHSAQVAAGFPEIPVEIAPRILRTSGQLQHIPLRPNIAGSIIAGPRLVSEQDLRGSYYHPLPPPETGGGVIIRSCGPPSCFRRGQGW